MTRPRSETRSTRPVPPTQPVEAETTPPGTQSGLSILLRTAVFVFLVPGLIFWLIKLLVH